MLMGRIAAQYATLPQLLLYDAQRSPLEVDKGSSFDRHECTGSSMFPDGQSSEL